MKYSMIINYFKTLSKYIRNNFYVEIFNIYFIYRYQKCLIVMVLHLARLQINQKMIGKGGLRNFLMKQMMAVKRGKKTNIVI